METKNINIAAGKIEVQSFTMTSEVLKFTPKDKFVMDLSLSFTSPTEDNVINFKIEVNLSKDGQPKIKLANLRTNNAFRIENSKDFLYPPKTPGGPMELDGDLVDFCLQTSLAHARGIWAVKTEGTPLEPTILPMLPMADLMGYLKSPVDNLTNNKDS